MTDYASTGTSPGLGPYSRGPFSRGGMGERLNLSMGLKRSSNVRLIERRYNPRVLRVSCRQHSNARNTADAARSMGNGM
eukprot:4901340-Heterocapsa_arctica.AAC.1